jgi:hypothetical protein
MNKLRFVPVLVFSLVIILVVSCKKNKDNVNGGTGNTDLQVYAVDSTEKPIQGAVVSIYYSQADRDAGTNSINSSLTGTEGFVYFSNIGAVLYYVSVVKHYDSGVTKTAKGDTGVPIKYQGQTALTVVLK